MILTYKFRIKDSSSRRKLKEFSSSVNFTWNYINNLSCQNIKLYSRFLSAYDIDNYLSGSSKELPLHSTTFQEISKTYVNNRKTFKKRKLNWRTSKRQLGWIPFKSSAIKLDQINNTITYNKNTFRYYNSRKLTGKIKSGSFVEDSQGRWYICLAVDIPEKEHHINSNSEIGIDMGIKDKLCLSDGTKFSRDNITKTYEKKLAAMQRAKRKKQVRKLSAKIKNIRNDWNHKVTSKIAKQFENIYLGNFKMTGLISENVSEINKSLYDSSPYQLQSFLEYKARKLGGKCNMVDEGYTTQTCSACFRCSGPQGVRGLKIRSWKCNFCHAEHDRDINAARNMILFSKNPVCDLQTGFGFGHETPLRESPTLR